MDLNRKLIIDSDCGVDDALAIIYALSCPCEVVAITCVNGNTSVDNAYSNVRRVLKVCQRTEIPVYRGSERPLGKSVECDNFFGMDGLGGVTDLYPPAENTAAAEHASLAMIRLAKEQKKNLTLVLIGPFTNAALAHRLDPGFTENLKDIVCLGGNSEGVGNSLPGAEFNFMTDPEAAHIIISEARCPIAIVPWEANIRSFVPWDLYDVWSRTDTPKGRFCRDITKMMLNTYYKENSIEGFELGDMLAIVAVLRPDAILKSADRRVSVELTGRYTRGQLIQAWTPEMLPDVKRTVRIITDFKKDLIWEFFMRILS